MNEKLARNVGPAKIDIAYECIGDEDSPPVALIMGIGSQMVAWPDGFCRALAKRDLRVVRFDNRDVGLSTHISNAPEPDFQAALAGDTSTAAYTLADMAADTIGLLDWLNIERAHIVGASMGGFIAQMIAIDFPKRVASLTSMMSTTGAASVGQPAAEAMSIFALPEPRNRVEAAQRSVDAQRIVGSPGFELDEEAVRNRAAVAYDRSYDPKGVMRQALAAMASGDRTSRLKKVVAPTLIIHGADDKMCNVSGGYATAECIPNSKLVVIEGMGHNLPEALWERICSLIADHAHQSSA